ncbi:hypothetical protein BG005_010481 [Podila minutissima]|nr:hypothetical protein BG005_010481 [Podila minutissima]
MISVEANAFHDNFTRSDPEPIAALPHPFTGQYDECGFPVTYLPELVLMAASNAIREKSNWWEKFKDPVISARWRQELAALREENHVPHQLADDQIDYLFLELEWYAEQRLKHVKPGNEIPTEIGIDGTRRADGLVPPGLKERLMGWVKKLMDVPEDQRDWHPDSNRQVLDLVHPQGKTMEVAPMDGGIESIYFSKKFQWLSTDFTISSEGRVKFESYINNVHPIEHKVMYPVLEEILELFIPMFEDVLMDMRAYPTKDKRFSVDFRDWYGDESQSFSPPSEPERYNLRTGQKLQVIVKLANIELTPENPRYTGGSWHVEGMASENIAASGIYYYH